MTTAQTSKRGSNWQTWRPKGEFDTALENLLAIVQQDRGFKDDAGRKTMIQVFSLMPSDSPLLRDYRSRLAAVLNR